MASVRSHPVWVRGLKLVKVNKFLTWREVAPRVGAWIETTITGVVTRTCHVAPRVGAWIETAQSVQA